MPDGKRRRLHKLEPEGRRPLLELWQQTILPNSVLDGKQHMCRNELKSFRARARELALPRWEKALRSVNSSASLLERGNKLSLAARLAWIRDDLIRNVHCSELSSQLREQGLEQFLRERPEYEKLW